MNPLIRPPIYRDWPLLLLALSFAIAGYALLASIT